ncbi:hypothetical protein PR048_027451 [Dryococelus australis]|uniref:Uncharacterized protein n=1 Tax=Dryococelus australis TaxID=614101 RepID=A0ABQ9GFI0_9NEOP|nr:hypothetical protein PR048_027451 [Dryococelus australis]
MYNYHISNRTGNRMRVSKLLQWLEHYYTTVIRKRQWVLCRDTLTRPWKILHSVAVQRVWNKRYSASAQRVQFTPVFGNPDQVLIAEKLVNKIDLKRLYTEVAYAIGSEFIRHALDDCANSRLAREQEANPVLSNVSLPGLPANRRNHKHSDKGSFLNRNPIERRDNETMAPPKCFPQSFHPPAFAPLPAFSLKKFQDSPLGIITKSSHPGRTRVRFQTWSLPDFRMWESCRTMPLVDGFSRGSPALLHAHLTQDIDWEEVATGPVKSRRECIRPSEVSGPAVVRGSPGVVRHVVEGRREGIRHRFPPASRTLLESPPPPPPHPHDGRPWRTDVRRRVRVGCVFVRLRPPPTRFYPHAVEIPRVRSGNGLARNPPDESTRGSVYLHLRLAHVLELPSRESLTAVRSHSDPYLIPDRLSPYQRMGTTTSVGPRKPFVSVCISVPRQEDLSEEISQFGQQMWSYAGTMLTHNYARRIPLKITSGHAGEAGGLLYCNQQRVYSRFATVKQSSDQIINSIGSSSRGAESLSDSSAVASPVSVNLSRLSSPPHTSRSLDDSQFSTLATGRIASRHCSKTGRREKKKSFWHNTGIHEALRDLGQVGTLLENAALLPKLGWKTPLASARPRKYARLHYITHTVSVTISGARLPRCVRLDRRRQLILVTARLTLSGDPRHVRNAGRPRSVRAVRLEEVIRQHIDDMPSTSTRSIARQTGVSHSTVWDVLWVHRRRPYRRQKGLPTEIRQREEGRGKVITLARRKMQSDYTCTKEEAKIALTSAVRQETVNIEQASATSWGRSAQWVENSPLTKVNRVRFPTGLLPDFLHVGNLSRRNTAHFVNRSDEALGMRVSVVRIVTSLLDLGRLTLDAQYHRAWIFSLAASINCTWASCELERVRRSRSCLALHGLIVFYFFAFSLLLCPPLPARALAGRLESSGTTSSQGRPHRPHHHHHHHHHHHTNHHSSHNHNHSSSHRHDARKEVEKFPRDLGDYRDRYFAFRDRIVKECAELWEEGDSRRFTERRKKTVRFDQQDWASLAGAARWGGDRQGSQDSQTKDSGIDTSSTFTSSEDSNRGEGPKVLARHDLVPTRPIAQVHFRSFSTLFLDPGGRTSRVSSNPDARATLVSSRRQLGM